MIADVWASFTAMPLWVRIWVAAILVPANMAALALIGHPGGWLIAVLAVGGMVPNAVMLLLMRGFSKAMALSHVALWLPLLWLIVQGAPGTGWHGALIWLIFLVDAFSLVFDIPETLAWMRGERGVFGRDG